MATILNEVNRGLHNSRMEVKAVDLATNKKISRGYLQVGLLGALAYTVDTSKEAEEALAEE